MATRNSDIAGIFERYATLLEIEDANPFRVRAYRNAARTIESLPRQVADLLEQGEDLTRLEGIGKDLAGKMREIVETGVLADMERLEEQAPESLLDLTALPGLGPKRVRLLHDELGISTLDDLEKAIGKGRLRGIAGFGERTVANIVEAIGRQRRAGERHPWLDAERAAQPLVRRLEAVRGVDTVVVAGSFRRCRETVGDLDILVTCADSGPVMASFVGYEQVDKVVSRGGTRSTVLLADGLQVDLRVVAAESYGAALVYFTGSKAHNIALRERAQRRGLKLSEYGLYEGNKRAAGRTEKKVYRRLGLPFIAPELRENNGEIEAAEDGRLPTLVEPGGIRGDLHAHTRATDGRDTLEAMASAARALGYRYLAITDRCGRSPAGMRLDAAGLRRQMNGIDRFNAKSRGFAILKGAEAEILRDGSLDLPEDLAAELDIVVGAVRRDFDLSRKRQTERIVRALDDPRLNILARPGGHRAGDGEGYAVDLERVMRRAREYGCFLELGAGPPRRDLYDTHCRMARELGLRVAVSAEAASADGLARMRLGVMQARRGWLEAGDVLNTLGLRELRKALERA